MLRIKRFLPLLLPLTVFAGCSADLSPQYGVLALSAPNGREVFFKREARLLDYDVLVLSATQDVCQEADPRRDYVFTGPARKIYYNFSGPSTLNLFVTSSATEPVEFSSSVKVIQHELDPLEYADLEKHFKDRGILLAAVPINPALKCR